MAVSGYTWNFSWEVALIEWLQHVNKLGDMSVLAGKFDELKMDGTQISFDVTVTNTGSAAVENIALSHRFPSGWEIRNERMYSNVEAPAGITWQDFRDDRVYSFFDLKAGQSVNVSVSLTATYPGRFYLPAISCAAMYDSSVSAVIPGRWVEVKERR